MIAMPVKMFKASDEIRKMKRKHRENHNKKKIIIRRKSRHFNT